MKIKNGIITAILIIWPLIFTLSSKCMFLPHIKQNRPIYIKTSILNQRWNLNQIRAEKILNVDVPHSDIKAIHEKMMIKESKTELIARFETFLNEGELDVEHASDGQWIPTEKSQGIINTFTAQLIAAGEIRDDIEKEIKKITDP